MQVTSSLALVLLGLLPAFGTALPQAKTTGAKSSATGAASSAAKSATGGTATGSATGAAGAQPTGAADAQPNNGAAQGAMPVSDTQLANAVMSWMNDTGKVSGFLNKATSLSGDDFTREATIAFNAEVDELNHKAVIDESMAQDPTLQTANDTLAGAGSFQAVVDALQTMVNDGPDTAQAMVDAINQNRCVNVLNNIDAYFAVAGMPSASAIRPTACLEISSTFNGVQPTAGAVLAQAQALGQLSTSAANAGGAATGAADNQASATSSATGGAAATGAAGNQAGGAASTTSAATASATGAAGNDAADDAATTTSAARASATGKAGNAGAAGKASTTTAASGAGKAAGNNAAAKNNAN